MNETLASVEQLIEVDLTQSLDKLNRQLSNGEIGEIGFNEDQKAHREEAAKKVQNVRDAFKSASGGEIQERVCFFFFFYFLVGLVFILTL